MAPKKQKEVEKKSPEVNVKEVERKERPKGNYLKKIKGVFLKPGKFFDSVEKESQYSLIINTLLIIYLIYFVIFIISDLILTGVGSSVQEYLVRFLSGFVAVVLSAVVSPFVLSGIIHVGVLVFRGKEKFFQTFKPVAYALVIGVIYSIISILVSLVIQVFVPLDASMLQGLENNVDPNVIFEAYMAYYSQPAAITTIIISFISLIHQFVVMIMGISKFQKIKKLRSAFSIVVPMLVIAAFFILITVILRLMTVSA